MAFVDRNIFNSDQQPQTPFMTWYSLSPVNNKSENTNKHHIDYNRNHPHFSHTTSKTKHTPGMKFKVLLAMRFPLQRKHLNGNLVAATAKMLLGELCSSCHQRHHHRSISRFARVRLGEITKKKHHRRSEDSHGNLVSVSMCRLLDGICLLIHSMFLLISCSTRAFTALIGY